MITAHQLTKIFGATRAVDGIDFIVRPGRVTGFLGPNGAGKSTTMRMILGLDRPDAGHGHRRRAPLPDHRRAAARGRRAARRARPSTRAAPPATICGGWPPATASRATASTRCSRWSGSSPWPASGPAASRSAWVSGSASPPRCSATRRS